MTRVEFRPFGAAIEVPQGTELLDAAIRAGITVDAPCGGKGTCGKCLVKVLKGEAKEKATEGAAADIPAGYRLACRTLVDADPIVVEVPEHDFASYDRFDDEESAEIMKLISPSHEDLPCRADALMLPAPEMDDGISDFERLSRELRRARGSAEVSADIECIRTIPDIVRSREGSVTAVSFRDGGRLFLQSLRAGEETEKIYGIAVDLGTTTISVSLIDIGRGSVLATRSGYNDQIPCGLDIISRINYASSDERLRELSRRALGTINRLTAALAAESGIGPDSIMAAVVSGNTVMTHLLLGIKPEYIRLEPYAPAVLSVPVFSAREIGLSVNGKARVRISPSVGSYVGGDITAGLLCTDFARDTDAVNLFIDIGTNGELALGNRDFILACACSAGPAFEGGGIECGMRAASGAINRVAIGEDNNLQSDVIGGVEPEGICGSGIIDLLAELFRAGQLDPSGRFVRGASPAIRETGRRASYLLADAPPAKKMVAVGELDIDNVMRAKAAIYSASLLLLGHAGIDFADLGTIYVAGGFGRYLNLRNAITIGLLPDVPLEKFSYIGNASLRGSAMALVSRRQCEIQDRLASRMTYINLSNDPGYMDQYTAALFLPHTDRARFPSVVSGMRRSG